MIPLKDEAHLRYFPFVTILLILLNVVVFLLPLLVHVGLIHGAPVSLKSFQNFVDAFAVVPAELTRGYHVPVPGRIPIPAISLVTNLFLHGGPGHLAMNMWFFWIFGDNIEDALGRFRFLVFYLLMGVLATLAQVIANPSSTIPLIGASGAIAGVLGAYFILFPRHRILTLVPIFFFITTARIPAAFYLGMWFVIQLIYSQMGGSVAWWAHVGGFVAGVLLIRLFLPRRR